MALSDTKSGSSRADARAPLRILFVVQVFYPSQAGGPANSVHWITKHLDKSRYSPRIVAGDLGLAEEIPRDTWMESDAGDVIYVTTGAKKASVKLAAVALREMPRADVVHLSSLFYPPSLLVGLVAVLRGKKVIWSPRGELDEPTYSAISGRQKKSAVAVLRRVVNKNVLFHSTCDVETENIRMAFGEAVRVVQIPNFIEPAELQPEGSLDYLLYLGRIHPKKGIENLLTALTLSRRFLASGLHLKLAGAGDSAYEATVRALPDKLGIASRVDFVGHVVGSEKQRLLAGARVTLMPSFNENFGMVVLESLLQNTPVIASTGSPWQALEEEKIGWWIDNSPSAIAGAIDQLIALSDDEYRSYRSRGRQFVLDRYSGEKNLSVWPKAYMRLLDGD